MSNYTLNTWWAMRDNITHDDSELLKFTFWTCLFSCKILNFSDDYLLIYFSEVKKIYKNNITSNILNNLKEAAALNILINFLNC